METTERQEAGQKPLEGFEGPRKGGDARPDEVQAFPPGLVLTPLARRPLTLPAATVNAVMSQPVPDGRARQAASPRASVIVVTFNNLVFTRLCLESALANTDHETYELIVVDNGSSDGTVDYLRELARKQAQVRVIFNDSNRGFAPANNQGLAAASGDILVLLNNDTVVPRGWLKGLVTHLNDAAIGLVGPVTNRIGNEAQIEARYHTYGELIEFAGSYTRRRAGSRFDIATLMMFCAALRRDVYRSVGPLDERFAVGMFEDDDYALRARAAGYRVVCAEDVFVHHFGQATIGKLALTGEYGELFHANRRRFEAKWGRAWQPHQHRPSEAYQQLILRIRKVVGERLPQAATVIVVSRGDEELLNLEGRTGWHLPGGANHAYAGHHPGSSLEAINEVEALRTRGGDFLLFPNPSFWWLDFYDGLSAHLESKYRRVWRDRDCIIYQLSQHACGDGEVS